MESPPRGPVAPINPALRPFLGQTNNIYDEGNFRSVAPATAPGTKAPETAIRFMRIAHAPADKAHGQRLARNRQPGRRDERRQISTRPAGRP